MYLDSSVIVKLLVDEPESAHYQDLLLKELLSSSELAATEVRSALLAKERSGTLNQKQRRSAWQVFDGMIQDRQILLHPLDSVVLKKAAHCLEICHPDIPLRTLDAIHVAACDLSQDFPLCTNDKRMRDAAKLMKIPIFPE